MCNTTPDHGDEPDEPDDQTFEITQRSLDGGRPRGQLTFDGAIAQTERDNGGDRN